MNKVLKSPWIRQFLKAIISILLLYYCFTLINVVEVINLIKNTKYIEFILAFIFTLLGTVVCKSYIVWHFLKEFKATKLLDVIKINFSLRFYTMVLPKALVAGIRWDKYRRISEPKYALVLLVFEALIALTVAALVALLFIFVDGSSVISTKVKLLSFGVFSILTAALVILFLYPDGRIYKYIEALLTAFRLNKIIGGVLEKWRNTVRLLNARKVQNFLPIFIVSLISHFLFLVGAFLLFMALDVDIEFSSVAWIRSIVFILVSIPISIAGIGLREVGFIALFGLYGLGANDIIAYAMLALAIQFGIGLLGIFTEIEYWFDSTKLRKSDPNA